MTHLTVFFLIFANAVTKIIVNKTTFYFFLIIIIRKIHIFFEKKK